MEEEEQKEESPTADKEAVEEEKEEEMEVEAQEEAKEEVKEAEDDTVELETNDFENDLLGADHPKDENKGDYLYLVFSFVH